MVPNGVVYTGKTKKIAEHGDADPEDRHVALLVYAPGVERGRGMQNGVRARRPCRGCAETRMNRMTGSRLPPIRGLWVAPGCRAPAGAGC